MKFAITETAKTAFSEKYPNAVNVWDNIAMIGFDIDESEMEVARMHINENEKTHVMEFNDAGFVFTANVSPFMAANMIIIEPESHAGRSYLTSANLLCDIEHERTAVKLHDTDKENAPKFEYNKAIVRTSREDGFEYAEVEMAPGSNTSDSRAIIDLNNVRAALDPFMQDIVQATLGEMEADWSWDDFDLCLGEYLSAVNIYIPALVHGDYTECRIDTASVNVMSCNGALIHEGDIDVEIPF